MFSTMSTSASYVWLKFLRRAHVCGSGSSSIATLLKTPAEMLLLVVSQWWHFLQKKKQKKNSFLNEFVYLDSEILEVSNQDAPKWDHLQVTRPSVSEHIPVCCTVLHKCHWQSTFCWVYSSVITGKRFLFTVLRHRGMRWPLVSGGFPSSWGWTNLS